MASAYTDAPESVVMDWIVTDDLADAIKKSVSNAKKGDVAGPVKVQEYWGIFLVEDSGIKGGKSLEEVKGEIEKELDTEYREKAFGYWLQQMVSDYFVGIYIY